MWILREIETRGGEVGFHDFMELALYHPENGYYQRGDAPWGRDRDYLTAPTASDWYGAVFARFLSLASKGVGRPVHLVDLASGDGSFLATVMAGLGGGRSKAVGEIVGVDRSSAARDLTRDRLDDVRPAVDVAERLPVSLPQPMVAHACELFDAMPVHRVEQTADGLMESTVAVEAGRLVWRRRPAGNEIEAYFVNQGVALEVGQIAEVNPDAEALHRKVLEQMGEGLVMVLDYGYPASRLYDPRGRRSGSLVSYRRHERGRDLLDTPGEQDLTAHVNWDDLKRAAAICGWEEIALIPLAEFLVRAGLPDVVEERGLGMEADLDADTMTARQEIKRLLDPEGMGSDLKMLIQAKGELVDVAREILNRPV